MLTAVRETIDKILDGYLIASQIQTLGALVYGLLNGEQAGIAAIGNSMGGTGTQKSNKNRVFRFLSNPRVDTRKISQAVVKAVTPKGGKPVVVATDWTEIGRLSVLASAIVTDGRAIPIYWTVIDSNKTRKGSVEVEHVRQLAVLLKGIPSVHVFDRGFDAADYLQDIDGLCHYVVRLSKDFLFRARPAGEWRKMTNKLLKRGRHHDFGRVDYTKGNPTECRIVALHDHQQVEPWILATNLYGQHRRAIVKYYAHRFRIEESFKDLKDIRAGFGLHGYRMRYPEHLSRLLAVMVLGYLIMTAAGHIGEEMEADKDINTRGSQRQLAVWRVGLALLEAGEPLRFLMERMSLLAVTLDEPNDLMLMVLPIKPSKRSKPDEIAA